MLIEYRGLSSQWMLTQTSSSIKNLLTKRLAFFLDFDGTLTPIVEHPDNVKVSDDLKNLLNQLTIYCDNAVAIVTGRTIASIDSLLYPLKLPVAGIHGAEWRLQSEVISDPSLLADIKHIATEINLLLQRFPMVWLENKHYSLAIHYRNAPDCKEALLAGINKLISHYPALAILHGKMVFEIKNANINKGHALQQYMDKAPFIDRYPVAIGDDLTDESAFRVANKLGGYSIKIGEGKTCAKHRLTDPKQLISWFEMLLSK